MFMTKVKGINNLALWLCASAVIIALSFIDTTPLLGVAQKHISLASLLMPLTGSMALWVAPFVVALRSVATFAVVGSWVSFALYLPGLLGAFAWRSSNVLLHVVVPVACMIAFVMHPQGAGAPWYALYWLIPIALWFVKKQSLTQRAAATTFVSHAVGSVVWLYAYTVPTEVWNSLMVIVPFERLLFALALVSVYNTAHVVLSMVQFAAKGRLLKGWNAH